MLITRILRLAGRISVSMNDIEITTGERSGLTWVTKGLVRDFVVWVIILIELTPHFGLSQPVGQLLRIKDIRAHGYER